MSVVVRQKGHVSPLALALGICACVLAAGCGNSTGTVRGTVRHAGQPITGGSVLFFLDDGRSIGGEILGDGNYVVENVPLGNAIVVVLPPAETDQQSRHMTIKNEKGKTPEPQPTAKFPEKYSDMATSDLAYRVVAGDNRFNIDLK